MQDPPEHKPNSVVPDPAPSNDGLSRRLVLLAASAGGTMLATGALMTSCGCCDLPGGASKDASGKGPIGPSPSGGAGGSAHRTAADVESDAALADLDLPGQNGEPKLEPPVEPTHDTEVAARQRAIEKARDFDSSFHDDVVVIDERMPLLKLVQQRIERTQKVVGHGHFGLFGFDDLLAAGRRFSKIGPFGIEEAAFLEELYSVKAADYGFFGDKVIDQLTHRHKRTSAERIRGTGHYLLKGPSYDIFAQMQQDVPSLVLTSGVRGLAKQFQLFLSKVVETEGNLSRAARSLAPPGYSHHGAGDFDVGAASLGSENFTEEFAATDEYKRLMDLGYVEIRYDLANQLGVRHEPWHIRVS